MATASSHPPPHRHQNQQHLHQLLHARRKISDFYRAHGDELAAIAGSRTLPPDWVIEFARYTTLTLSAPPGWVPGAPLIGSHPPAPQPEEMRDGALQRYNQQGSSSSSSNSSSGASNESKVAEPEKPPAQSLRGAAPSPGKRKPMPPPPPPRQRQPAAPPQQERPEPAPPQKKARQVTMSFGLSDSESGDDD